MSTVGITVLVSLLTLCVGVALGATWTVQALDRQFRRLAAERGELNRLRLSLREYSLRCPWCGRVIGSAGSGCPSIGSLLEGNGAIGGDHSHAETSRMASAPR